MAQLIKVRDTEQPYDIDIVTREIVSRTNNEKILVRGDHNSESITFVLPRYIENHDMMLCNKIELHFVNISSDRKNKSGDIFYIEDMHAVEDDQNTLMFTWLISRTATKYAGVLNFDIKFKQIEDEVILYKWGTATYKSFTVLEDESSVAQPDEPYSDLLESWKAQITEEITADVVNDVVKYIPEVHGEVFYITRVTVGDETLKV